MDSECQDKNSAGLVIRSSGINRYRRGYETTHFSAAQILSSCSPFVAELLF